MTSDCHIKSFSNGCRIPGKHAKISLSIGLAKDKLNSIIMINNIKHNKYHNLLLSFGLFEHYIIHYTTDLKLLNQRHWSISTGCRNTGTKWRSFSWMASKSIEQLTFLRT